jgi:hypothetical protein
MVSASAGCPGTGITEGIDRIGVDWKKQDRSCQQSYRASQAERSFEERFHIEPLKIGVPMGEICPTRNLG